MGVEREVIVGVGSNLGSREALVRAARDLLAATPGVHLTKTSPLLETTPMGPAQPAYLNGAFLLRTALSADALLKSLLGIERALDRTRRERWGPRTLDLDLLWIDGESVATEALTVPHAELTRRTFALGPLVALRPEARAPDGSPYADALRALAPDTGERRSPFSDGFACTAVEHTADEGFVVVARDRPDLFAAAAECLGAIIVDGDAVAPTIAVPIERALEADDDDGERMFAWLSEVLYHLDAGRLALRRAVVFEDGDRTLRGCLFGEHLDESRHTVRAAVKAMTWHCLEVGVTGLDGDGAWRAQVVLDL